MALELCRFQVGTDRKVRFGAREAGRLMDLSETELPTLAAALTVPASELAGRVRAAMGQGRPVEGEHLLAPVDQQEVWAAGVTYRRSRDARMVESSEASVYDRVYTAARPEIFLKATPHRVVGPGAAVWLRSDARWNVPEPELGVVANRQGEIVGYTVGNDLSSRDIEGENPLYLPQAKVWSGSCAVGPTITLADAAIDPTRLTITCTIRRAGTDVFTGSTTTDQIVRPLTDLVEYLYRDNEHPVGCILLTGTGIVPPDELTLQPDDVVTITIDGLGTLRNPVRRHGG